jgi:hypothetical protein
MLGGGLILTGIIFVAVMVQMRLGVRAAERAIERIHIDQVQSLSQECISVFANAFDIRLDLDDFEESARALSGQMDQADMLRKSFAQEEFDWYCVLPLGAFMGELLRVHANGSWRSAASGGLELMIPAGEESVRIRPFQRVLEHLTAAGAPGAIYADLDASRQLEKPDDRPAPTDSAEL